MTHIDILSDTESDGYETISYAVMCDDLSEVIEGEKLPLDLKRAVPSRRLVGKHQIV